MLIAVFPRCLSVRIVRMAVLEMLILEILKIDES